MVVDAPAKPVHFEFKHCSYHVKVRSDGRGLGNTQQPAGAGVATQFAVLLHKHGRLLLRSVWPRRKSTRPETASKSLGLGLGLRLRLRLG